jgi:phosphonate transport system ATP-binding protein
MIRINKLTVTYPNGVTALHPTDLSVEAGRFLVLLGPSGAGKSSLLRCLNGLVRPTGGGVDCGPEGSIFASRRRLRAHCRLTGMVFQHHHLIGRMTALQNVLTGRLSRYHTMRTLVPLPAEDRRVALSALERVGLLDRALERADRLSGGQQQRVGIARELAQEPSLILADEPVASLDPATSERVLADLRRICAEDGITAIVSLHQVEYARTFADEIVGLSDGRIVFRGGPSELRPDVLDRIYSASPIPDLAAE